MNGFRFADPFWLLALPAIAALFLWSARRERKGAILYSSLAGLKDLPRTAAQRVKRLLHPLYFAGLSLAVVALARPQKGLESFRIHTNGIAIEMCLDRSGSMRAMDFEEKGKRVSRVAVVRKVFSEFVKKRPDDWIGLVSFGGFPETLCPLTLDHEALQESIRQVKVPDPILDSQGNVLDASAYREELQTAIGDALAVGEARLKEVPAKSKILVLLSDGGNTAGTVDPLDAAKAAKKLGIKVYTIGIGTTGVVPFPQQDAYGRTVLVPSRVELDAAALQKIAKTTGGRYFNARDTAGLKEIYDTIDRLQKTKTKGRLYTQYRELYRAALWPAAGLMLLVLCAGATRFRSLPS